MATLTSQEFDTMMRLLSEHYTLSVLHQRLVQANALVSRKRPPRWQPLANQLYQLSSGLRREHPARYALELLWQDLISSSINDDGQEKIDSLAEGVNACLTEKFQIIPQKNDALMLALGSYHKELAYAHNNEIAYTELLFRASQDVAQFLRANGDKIIEAAAASDEQRDQGQTGND